MVVIVGCPENITGQTDIIQDVVKLIRCLECFENKDKTTITVSISYDLSSVQSRDERNSMNLLGRLLVKLCQNGSRLIASRDLADAVLDAVLDANLAQPTRPESSGTHRTGDNEIICLNEPCLQDLTLSDGRVSQTVAFKLPFGHGHDEALLGINLRGVSPAVDVQDDGPYNGIVRVIAKFVDPESKRWLNHGSGTVIDDQHVMTVGHTVWHREYGLAMSITIRRDGRIGSGIRRVDRGGVHFRWAKDSLTRNDFAILHVSEPFCDRIRLMKYKKTPTDVGTIGAKAYGFSSDMPKDADGEWLPHLCWSQSQVRYVPSPDNLLHHDGDQPSRQ
ncbi:hypothetical protein F4804DRAFT_339212 [Jackrogersella minutella]|nr:hypothetical protein F4804DRAFT_339212 [Jackrogersella minutella]